MEDYTSKDFKTDKSYRQINLYERLNRGEQVIKSELAREFGVTEKTIQRDFEELRSYLMEMHNTEIDTLLKYDRQQGGYRLLRRETDWLTNKEVLALCKVLLESRAFQPEEMNRMLDKLLLQVVPNDRRTVSDMIRKERDQYVPLQHKKMLLDRIWDLTGLIRKQEVVQIQYIKLDQTRRIHLIKPVAIMFSEFYFYLISYMADGTKDFPTIFRIDRIQELKGTGQKFEIPYRDRFKDGEFRKRVQFMYSGELKYVTFEYSGPNIEAVLDKLPTADIIKTENGIYTVTAQSFGNGIYMWLNSQGDAVKLISKGPVSGNALRQ